MRCASRPCRNSTPAGSSGTRSPRVSQRCHGRVCRARSAACRSTARTWASAEDVQDLFEQLIQPDSVQFPNRSKRTTPPRTTPTSAPPSAPAASRRLPPTSGPVRTGGCDALGVPVRAALFCAVPRCSTRSGHAGGLRLRVLRRHRDRHRQLPRRLDVPPRNAGPAARPAGRQKYLDAEAAGLTASVNTLKPVIGCT